MDKLISIDCSYVGKSIVSRKSDTVFVLQTTTETNPSESDWITVSKYVSQQVPFYETDLTSDIIRDKFQTSGSLDIIVSEDSKKFRVRYSGSTTETWKSAEGNIEFN